MTYSFNLLSFLIVFAAMIGNANIMGVDLYFVGILPLKLFVLGMRSQRKIDRQSLLAFIATALLMTVVAAKAYSLDIPYFEYYHLWPLKALIFALVLLFLRPMTWPNGNNFLWLCFCLALLGLGISVGGRFGSVFGPNMLYRMFALLFAFGLLESFQKRSQSYYLRLALIFVGVFSVILTGSVGGLLVLVVLIFVVIGDRVQRKRVAVIGFTGLAVVIVLFQTGQFDFQFLSRAIYKLNTGVDAVRFTGWQFIMTDGFSFLGHGYDRYISIWVYGYSYPHNSFVELYGYYGLPGVTIIGLILYTLVFGRQQLGPLYYPFVIILTGSMLSGDLSDNYAVVGFSIAAIVMKLRKVHSVFRYTETLGRAPLGDK